MRLNRRTRIAVSAMSLMMLGATSGCANNNKAAEDGMAARIEAAASKAESAANKAADAAAKAASAADRAEAAAQKAEGMFRTKTYK